MHDQTLNKKIKLISNKFHFCEYVGWNAEEKNGPEFTEAAAKMRESVLQLIIITNCV